MRCEISPSFYWLPWYNKQGSWYYGNGMPWDFYYTDHYAGWLWWQFTWRTST